jgi:hypothetical protein
LFESDGIGPTDAEGVDDPVDVDNPADVDESKGADESNDTGTFEWKPRFSIESLAINPLSILQAK